MGIIHVYYAQKHGCALCMAEYGITPLVLFHVENPPKNLASQFCLQ